MIPRIFREFWAQFIGSEPNESTQCVKRLKGFVITIKHGVRERKPSNCLGQLIAESRKRLCETS